MFGNRNQGWPMAILIEKGFLREGFLQENLEGDFSLSMVPCERNEPNSDQNNFGV